MTTLNGVILIDVPKGAKEFHIMKTMGEHKAWIRSMGKEPKTSIILKKEI
jgi:hypothetical protein